MTPNQSISTVLEQLKQKKSRINPRSTFAKTLAQMYDIQTEVLTKDLNFREIHSRFHSNQTFLDCALDARDWLDGKTDEFRFPSLF